MESDTGTSPAKSVQQHRASDAKQHSPATGVLIPYVGGIIVLFVAAIILSIVAGGGFIWGVAILGAVVISLLLSAAALPHLRGWE